MSSGEQLERVLADMLGPIVEATVRRVVREELARRPGADEYLSIARAAQVADVAPATVRDWIAQGKLRRYQAGRELRVRRAELDQFMAEHTDGRAPSPEQEADRLFETRRRTMSNGG